MAVSLFESHRPREASITVSLSPDFSGDYVAPGAADDVSINAAVAEMVGLGGGEVVLLHGDYQLTATVNVPANVMLRGVGWETVLNYDAGGNCLTVTGDNAKIRDLKIVIVAGAGAGGTRPNCIFNDRGNVEITKVWLIGDETVGDDGSDVRQCGIVFDGATFSRVAFIRSDDHMRNGIYLGSSSDNTVSGNTCSGNTRYGISFFSSSDNNTLSGNTCQGNTWDGIHLDSSSDNTLTGNTCQGNTLYGLLLYATSNDNTVTGNTCSGNTRDGIYLHSSSDNTLTGNTCQGNTHNGILLESSSDDNTIVGNTCFQNVWNGILLDTSSGNTIVGNTCNENDVNNTNTYDGICIEDDSDDNLVHCNTCNENDRWGISIGVAADDCVRNWVKDNQLRGNNSGAFFDGGTDTKLPELFRGVLDPDTNLGAHPAVNLPDGVDTTVRFQIQIPLEYQMLVRAQIIVAQTVTAAGPPDMQWSTVTNFGKICNDQAYNVRSDAETDQTTPVAINNLVCIDVILSLDGILAGDLIGFEFIRRATQAGDTIEAAAYFLGFRLQYV